jgi:predicted transglutaminase-like cysteine proteinase
MVTGTKSAVALLLALVMGGLASPALAEVPVPTGFKVMCVLHAAECRGGGAKSVKLTDELMELLERVNAEVNSSIAPVRESAERDVWTPGASRGDCEEYVLAKRRALIRNGIPASALSYVYALRNGGGHAILAVHTSGGSFALDNMSGRVKPLGRTGYRIVSLSGPDPTVWRRL